MKDSIIFLLGCPETAELMRELTPDELAAVELSTRDFDLGVISKRPS